MATVDQTKFHQSRPPLAALRLHRPGLPDAEARVADAVLENPQLVTTESVGDLAARAASATATVVRLCRRIGFDGFYRFKISLAQELGSVQQFGHPAVEGGAPSALHTAMAADARDIANAIPLVDERAFTDTVDAIASASEVLFAGVGTSAPLAQLAALHFLVLGIRASAALDVHAQDLMARLLRSDAACVLISHTGSSRETIGIAKSARAAGARTVAITSFARSPLAKACDIVLATGDRTDPRTLELFTTRAVHVSLLGALHAAVAAQVPAERVFEAVSEVAGRHLQ
jgi:DNA-binding MurR/RpiR family transcriptional regulator